MLCTTTVCVYMISSHLRVKDIAGNVSKASDSFHPPQLLLHKMCECVNVRVIVATIRWVLTLESRDRWFIVLVLKSFITTVFWKEKLCFLFFCQVVFPKSTNRCEHLSNIIYKFQCLKIIVSARCKSWRPNFLTCLDKKTITGNSVFLPAVKRYPVIDFSFTNSCSSCRLTVDLLVKLGISSLPYKIWSFDNGHTDTGRYLISLRILIRMDRKRTEEVCQLDIFFQPRCFVLNMN